MAVLGMANEVQSSTGQNTELNPPSTTFTAAAIRPVSPKISQADTLSPPSYVEAPSYVHLPRETQTQTQTQTLQLFQTLDVENAAPTLPRDRNRDHQRRSHIHFLLLLFFVLLKLLFNINSVFMTLLCTSRDFRMLDSMLVVWASVATCQMLQAQFLRGGTEGSRVGRYEFGAWALTLCLGVSLLLFDWRRDCK